MHADSGGGALLGQTLEGRYRIDAYLARGGMSTVYQGVDLRLDRPVAIKVMTPQYAADPTFLMRFEREARAAAKLDNPHVVGVFDQGRDGDNVFLIMELVDGGTLRDVIHEQGTLSLRAALSVLEPVLDALAAAHRAGLVHRDVKPENVLISARGEVKVADFGLVRAVTSTTVATGDVILGTVAYLSPEQVETGASDERSDVYSAGLLAFEMLTGNPPFAGDNALSVAYQHVHSDVPRIAEAAPAVPAAIAAEIDRATSRDPLGRPANAGEFLQRLRGARLHQGVTLGAVPVPRTASAKRKARTAGLPAGQTAGHTAIQPAGQPEATTARRTRVALSPARLRRRRIRLIALIAVLLLAAGATFAGIYLANQWTSAPDTSQQLGAVAASAIESAGLVPAMTTRLDNAVPSGQVISMSPPADTRQRVGSTVTLVVSAGRPVVPALDAGTSEDDATAAIRAAHLTPVTDATANVYDAKIPAGTVIGTQPAAGEHANIDAEVLLVLSKGPPPAPIPDVKGKQPEDARNKLVVDGFTVGPQQTRFDATVDAGTVIGTDPPIGTDTPRDEPVSLIVAVSKTVPEPLSGPLDAAAADLKAQGFTVTIGKAVFDQYTPGGDVVRIEPAPGTRIDPADPAVTLIGSNAVTTPKVTGLTVKNAKQTLSDLDLNYNVRSLFGSNSAIVTSQSPEAGTLVRPAAVIQLDAWP